MVLSANHLNQTEQKCLTEIGEIIVSAIAPEKIICFGTRVSRQIDWSCFTASDQKDLEFCMAFDILIITGPSETRADHEIIQIIEQKCEPFADLNILVHSLGPVNGALENGNRFFSTLYHTGILLYDNSRNPLRPPQPIPAEFALLREKMEKEWSHRHGLAKEFCDMAAQCLSSGWYPVGIFMLHQAFEHNCFALIRLFTGYRTQTHNLNRLKALTENFSPLAMLLFPCTTRDEKELFKLLVQGYSDARYDDKYIITEGKAFILLDRLREFEKIAEELYTQKINALEIQESISSPIA